jgi:hypothetical protein
MVMVRMTAAMTAMIVRTLRWVRFVVVCVMVGGRGEGRQGPEAGAGAGVIAVAVARGVRERG